MADKAKQHEAYVRWYAKNKVRLAEQRKDPAFRERRSLWAKAYNARNREELLAQKKTYYTENRQAIRDKVRAKMYGVSPDAIRALLIEQDSRCAICGAKLAKWHLDHDHATGKVRGLLCSNCNSGIGMLGDDPGRVAAASQYLASHADYGFLP